MTDPHQYPERLLPIVTVLGAHPEFVWDAYDDEPLTPQELTALAQNLYDAMEHQRLEHVADVVTCKQRIDALEELVAYLRVGRFPTEELHSRLERTSIHLDRLKERGPWPI